ncbi:hypothetical protein PRZ61_12450 [Halomonas pacifica]|uniref:hypothetical protein n=1 Tax=Bisbaumannia pacifica TaxID=77098 RepID=UPI002358877A|nr:hypothetical protein [Halomonas pacifica]MDC8804252.1 hypothetical protein [Halomonas pacifica]
MARKPVHLTADAKRPEGRQVIWEAIRRLRTFNVGDLEIATYLKEATIRSYVEALAKGGYLQRAQGQPRREARFPPVTWTLIRDVGVEAPRLTKQGKPCTAGLGREQMWRTMRIIGEFDLHSLAVQASTEAHPVSHREAEYYIRYMHRAGYLHQVAKGGPGRPGRYRLIPSRYTGPGAPQVQRIRQVWDPNREEVVWRPEDGGHE